MFAAVIGTLPLKDGVTAEHSVMAATRDGKLLMTGVLTGPRVPGDGDRAFKAELPNPFGIPHGKAVARGDIDLDGRIDVVHTANNGGDRTKPGVCWIRAGSGNQAFDISGPEGIKFDRIELLDLDGDGDLDVITCEERDNLGVIWYENPTK